MSLPVRSCLCRRHSEHFEGPLGPQRWLRLLRRSTCSKRGSVRGFFLIYIGFFFFFFLPFSRIQSRDAPETKIGTIFLACPRSTQVHVQGLFEIRRCDIIYKCVKAICSDLVYFFFFFNVDYIQEAVAT